MKRFFITAMTAVLFLSQSVPAEDSADVERKFRADISEGVALLKAGGRDNTTRAIARFKSALRVRKESAEAYYWIGLTYSDQGNYMRAAENAKEATAYDDQMAEAWLLWGQSLMYQRDWDQALEKLETAYRLAPDDPLVLFDLGRVYYHGKSNPDLALPKFRAVWDKGQRLRRERPELMPIVVQSRLYIGYCEQDRGKVESAINAFRDVLSEMPNNHEAMLRLAIAYRDANRPADAVRVLNEIIESLEGKSGSSRYLAEAHVQLGSLYLSVPGLRNRTFALASLKRFVELNPEGHPMLPAAKQFLVENDLKEGK